MCISAIIRKDGKDIEVNTVGELREAGFAPVPEHEGMDWGDDFCLCGVNLYATADAAGYIAQNNQRMPGYWPGFITILPKPEQSSR